MKVVSKLPDSKTHKNMFAPTYHKVLVSKYTNEIIEWSPKLAAMPNEWETVKNPVAIEKAGVLQNKKDCVKNVKYIKDIKSRDKKRGSTNEEIRLLNEVEQMKKQLRKLGFDPETGKKIESVGVDSSDDHLVAQRNAAKVAQMLPDDAIEAQAKRVLGDEVEVVKSVSSRKKVVENNDPDGYLAKLDEIAELNDREEIDSFVEDNFEFTSRGMALSDMRIIKALQRFYNYEISPAELELNIGASEEAVVESAAQDTVDAIQEEIDHPSKNAIAADEELDFNKLKRPGLNELMKTVHSIDLSEVSMNYMKLRSICREVHEGKRNINSFMMLVKEAKQVAIGA